MKRLFQLKEELELIQKRCHAERSRSGARRSSGGVEASLPWHDCCKGRDSRSARNDNCMRRTLTASALRSPESRYPSPHFPFFRRSQQCNLPHAPLEDSGKLSRLVFAKLPRPSLLQEFCIPWARCRD